MESQPGGSGVYVPRFNAPNGTYNRQRVPGKNTMVCGTFPGNASYFVHDDDVRNNDNDNFTCSDIGVMYDKVNNVDGLHTNNNETSDCEFIIPLFVDDKETQAIWDSGNLGPVLISENLVSPEKIIPGKYSSGSVDASARQNTVHKLPMARIKICFPWFNYDRNVTINATVCKLPKEFSCVIGNSLFRRHRQLQDVISVRRYPHSAASN